MQESKNKQPSRVLSNTSGHDIGNQTFENTGHWAYYMCEKQNGDDKFDAGRKATAGGGTIEHRMTIRG
jgi:hypothetical protein